MLAYYFDEMLSERLALALRAQKIEIVRAIELGLLNQDEDTDHLPAAIIRALVLVTFDKGFAGRATKRDHHTGVVCWTGGLADYGGQIRALHDFAQKHAPNDVKGRVFWLK